MPSTPPTEALIENKREMSDGMRAYHESEINHTNHAITMLLAVAGAAGAVTLAILFPQNPPKHIAEVVWGLWFTVTVVAFIIAFTTHLKISADHKVYANFGAEYVKTSRLLGFYENVVIDNTATSIKTSKTVGQGSGYRRTQAIIWSFAIVQSVLTLLFAVFSYQLT